MNDKYLIHIESGEVSHGKITYLSYREVYTEIAKSMAEATMDDKLASITTIAKRPDGSFIMVRRRWGEDDEMDATPPPDPS